MSECQGHSGREDVEGVIASSKKRKEQELTAFGVGVKRACNYLGLFPIDVAREGGLNGSTISKVINAETSTKNPELETVSQIVNALERLAERERKEWEDEWSDALYNLACYASPRQYKQAVDTIATVDNVPAPPPRRRPAIYKK